jgi:Developmentally Regulated MAPK Interacting Protein.
MNQTIRYLVPLFLFVFIFSTLSAQNQLWTDANNPAIRQNLSGRSVQALPSTYRLVQLNTSLARQLQDQAPLETASNRQAVAASAVPFSMPLPEGGFIGSSIYESPIVSREIQRKRSNLKTYQLIDQNKSSYGRMTITSAGITGILFTDNGGVYISPVGKEFPGVHMVYYIRDARSLSPMVCNVLEQVESLGNFRNAKVDFGDGQFRTYRLAVAATGEYVDWAGSQDDAVDYITTTVNNINAIYERELSIRFTLVIDYNVIFPDSTADPYTPGLAASGADLNVNHSTLTSTIGTANFDLGIVFHYGWNGGIAQLQSVCSGTVKGRAAAGSDFGTGANPLPGPQGPIFDVTVAHEIAHQFGATHTFVANNGVCGSNVTPTSAVEPGGGSTIMAYAGVCSPNFYQAQSDAYFHGVSIYQMLYFAVNSTPCAALSSSGNTKPVFVSPPNESTFTIPASTPFFLAAGALDAEGNTLTYSWEQVNPGAATSGPPSPTATTGPNFRSMPPSVNATRTFPRLADLVNGTSSPYEVLPTVSRSMDFLCTVRDNVATGGLTDSVWVTVTTHAGAGPFVVTSQATNETWTADGTSTATITWNVANTTAAPVNCANVDILFSTDGGFTYPYVLASHVPNDGSHDITVPNLPTTVGRVRVQASDNIFFNINAGFITINSVCEANGVTISPSQTVTAPAGSAALDLNLSPGFGVPVNISGTLQSTDPHSYLATHYNTPASCIEFSNDFRYDVYRFTVSETGIYSFSRGVGGAWVYNIYLDDFAPGTPCQNLVASNATYNSVAGSVSLTNPLEVQLIKGVYYIMAVGTFSNTQPALPFNYSVNVTPPPGGGIFTAPISPAGYSYTYVIVSDFTGKIVAIDPDANLSNPANFPAGDYTIWGLSYSNSIDPATLNAFVGGPFSDLQNAAMFQPGTVCSQLSLNAVPVIITGALPAGMLPLKASQVNNTVQLKWGTVWEQDTKHFEIWRSSDGVHFETLVATVPAKGSSNNTVNYTAIDQAPLNGKNYYRVKQVDLDGDASYSNIAVIDITLPVTLTAVYPNPAKATLTLEYITDKAGTVNVAIIDGKGAVVQRTQFNAQAGRNIRSLQVAALAKGIYALQITDSEKTETKRFIKE